MKELGSLAENIVFPLGASTSNKINARIGVLRPKWAEMRQIRRNLRQKYGSVPIGPETVLKGSCHSSLCVRYAALCYYSDVLSYLRYGIVWFFGIAHVL